MSHRREIETTSATKRLLKEMSGLGELLDTSAMARAALVRKATMLRDAQGFKTLQFLAETVRP
jgi:hypothetical protein